MMTILAAVVAVSLASCGQPQVEQEPSVEEIEEMMAESERIALNVKLTPNSGALLHYETAILYLGGLVPTDEADPQARTTVLASYCRARNDHLQERETLLDGKPDVMSREDFERKGEVDDICRNYTVS